MPDMFHSTICKTYVNVLQEQDVGNVSAKQKMTAAAIEKNRNCLSIVRHVLRECVGYTVPSRGPVKICY